MSAGNALRALLAADAGVAALVAARITADRMDQDKPLPYVVYVQTGAEDFRTLDGSVVDSRHAFEVQVWANTRISADQVATAVRTAINASDNAEVVNVASAYDDELDLEATILTITWWG